MVKTTLGCEEGDSKLKRSEKYWAKQLFLFLMNE
jgi:hypothetical protein